MGEPRQWLMAVIAVVGGCSVAIDDLTSPTLTRNGVSTYDLTARAERSAGGIDITSVTARVAGTPFPMTAAGGELWQARVPVNPCLRGFDLVLEAAWEFFPVLSETERDLAEGANLKWISGSPPAECPVTFGLQLAVDNTLDEIDIAPGNRICATAAGTCTLRAAIIEANATPGADLITLQPGRTYPLTRIGANDTASSGDLDITDSVVIAAGEDGATVDAETINERLFDVFISDAGVTVAMTRLTLRGGSGGGGAIRNRAALTLDRCRIENNRSPGSGGGIWNDAWLRVVDTVIADNAANLQRGGGIANEGGTVEMVHATISGNSAEVYGGGIYNIAAGTTRLRNATIFGNTADADGSGFGDGGGVFNAASASHFVLASSVIAGNDDPTAPVERDCHGAFFSWDYNLIGIGDGCRFEGAVTSNQVGTADRPIDPRLGSLSLNGGPTPTHNPLPGSPLRDTGNPAPVSDASFIVCPSVDQRGVARPSDFDGVGGARCDIGAVED